MIDKREVASNYPSSNFDGELTLAGAVRKYWHVISYKWRAIRTVNENIADYEKRILFNTPLKALRDYTAHDFKEIVDRLAEKNDYRSGTKDHYLYLVEIVINACREGGEVLHSSVILKNMRNPNRERRPLVKSLSQREEVLFDEWAQSLDVRSIIGAELAVAIMFYYGLRNQEAAGLEFIDYDEGTNHSVPIMRVRQTMVGHSRRTKLKGKSPNAHREIPCLNETICRLINERKEYVLSETSCHLDDLAFFPVCPSEKEFTHHCTINEITKCAQEVFEQIGIHGNQWEDVLSTNDAEDYNEIVEDAGTPQAYALRRNAITRFYSSPIELDEAELHYIAGHEINITGIIRSDYTNPDAMSPIIRKMQRHRFYSMKEMMY